MISYEKSFNDLLVTSDLHIFTWVSTTFMQSLYTDSDIFLLDKSDITEESKIFLNNTLALTSTDKFIQKLDEYLRNNLFYTQNKDVIRNFFIDYSNKNKRVKIVNESIEKQL